MTDVTITLTAEDALRLEKHHRRMSDYDQEGKTGFHAGIARQIERARAGEGAK